MSKPASPLQRAWAAGVVESKMNFPKAGYFLDLNSTDEVMLQRFLKIVGYGDIASVERRGMVSVSYRWQSRKADDTREILLSLSPFFSARTLKNAAIMIAKIERSPYWSQNYPEKAAHAVAIDPALIEEYVPPKVPYKRNEKSLKISFPVIKPESEFGFKGHPRHRDVHDRIARRWIETGWGGVKIQREFPEIKLQTVLMWIRNLQLKAASLGMALAANAEVQTPQPSTQAGGSNASRAAKTTKTVMRTEKVTLD